MLEKSFVRLKKIFPDIVLDTCVYTKDILLTHLAECYCLIVPSLSEVSPNIVFDALSVGTPVIVTEDCGLKDRIGDIVLWVNPKNEQTVYDAMSSLMNSTVYDSYVSRIYGFSYSHTSRDIAQEFISIF